MSPMPLSTRLQDYGLFHVVSGDYGDQFLILTKWSSDVLLYSIQEDKLSLINEYESLYDLMKEYPSFEIINPNNSNERYLPGYGVKDEKQLWLKAGGHSEKTPVFKPIGS